MNPLVVIGRLGEALNTVLVHGQPVAGRQILANHARQLGHRVVLHPEVSSG
jgi:hypothetical protein